MDVCGMHLIDAKGHIDAEGHDTLSFEAIVNMACTDTQLGA